jgi:hypothetical protein
VGDDRVRAVVKNEAGIHVHTIRAAVSAPVWITMTTDALELSFDVHTMDQTMPVALSSLSSLITLDEDQLAQGALLTSSVHLNAKGGSAGLGLGASANGAWATSSPPPTAPAAPERVALTDANTGQERPGYRSQNNAGTRFNNDPGVSRVGIKRESSKAQPMVTFEGNAAVFVGQSSLQCKVSRTPGVPSAMATPNFAAKVTYLSGARYVTAGWSGADPTRTGDPSSICPVTVGTFTCDVKDIR